MRVTNQSSEEIVALDDALNRLAALDERKVRVVEMKFFAGLKVAEIADVLKVSPRDRQTRLEFCPNLVVTRTEKVRACSDHARDLSPLCYSRKR